MNTPLPTSEPEWRSAVDSAMAALVLSSAYQRGFIHAMPEPSQDRARRILGIAKQRGIEPRPNGVERRVISTIREERRRLRKLLEIGLDTPQ